MAKQQKWFDDSVQTVKQTVILEIAQLESKIAYVHRCCESVGIAREDGESILTGIRAEIQLWNAALSSIEQAALTHSVPSA